MPCARHNRYQRKKTAKAHNIQATDYASDLSPPASPVDIADCSGSLSLDDCTCAPSLVDIGDDCLDSASSTAGETEGLSEERHALLPAPAKSSDEKVKELEAILADLGVAEERAAIVVDSVRNDIRHDARQRRWSSR